MPHDANGVLIEKGDVVWMPFRVEEVYPNEDACNVQMVSVKEPAGESAQHLACNSRFVVKDQPVFFAFAPNQKVRVKVNQANGKVLSVDLDRDCKKNVFVEYVLASGELASRWFREDEIDPLT